MATTVADVVIAALKASGVRRVYGIPGDSLNGFTDALRRAGGISWQHVRHEEAAAFAAAGEAAVTGELAVCAASCGPGNLHLINGLFDANRSRVPVLAIAAHIPREEIGREYFQETHPQQLFRECSVYCELVSVAGQLPAVLQIAMRAALQRSGVAVVVVPGEVFLDDAPSGAKPGPVREAAAVIRPADADLAAAADALNGASRVTILAGAELIGSFNHGSMANALPQAIGAQACQQDRQVVSLSGDGGIAMLLGELLTLRQNRLPVKVVVFNNGALSFVELEMKAAGIVTFGTDLINPDFTQIARAAGLFALQVDLAEQLEDALQETFAHDGPALLDVRIKRHELALPPKLTYGQLKGFTLYATRTILSGGGEKLVELAKTNVRQVEAE